MSRLKFRNAVRSSAGVATAALLISGCTAARLPTYDPQSVGEYAQKQERDGLVVAVKPLTDVAEIERYFGHNLIGDGVLPIFLVAENHSSDASFILRKANITLKTLEQKVDGPNQNDLEARRAGKAIDAVATASVLLVPIFYVPLRSVAVTMISTDAERKYTFLTNELQSHTLPPGERASGFLYLKLPEGGSLPANTVLRVEALHPGSPDRTRLDLALSSQGY